MITINSFDTGLTQDERAKLYPTCGNLHPDGLQELRRTDSYDAVRDVAARYPVNYLFSFFFFRINLLFDLF
jgi:V-type H+-transporting ATPase subunit d